VIVFDIVSLQEINRSENLVLMEEILDSRDDSCIFS
jgi:hypothetical protein